MLSFQDIFYTILQMSLTGSFAVCIALLFRPLLVRLPRVYAYILWLVIFLRLLVPVLPESRLSLIPSQLSSVSLTESSSISKTETGSTADHIITDRESAYSARPDLERINLSSQLPKGNSKYYLVPESAKAQPDSITNDSKLSLRQIRPPQFQPKRTKSATKTNQIV